MLEGQRFNQPELATTATYYSAVHEVIHADDYTNGNRLRARTIFNRLIATRSRKWSGS
jgi:hypothetical protein